MEDKEWFQLPTGVQNIVAIFNWIKSELVRNANKLWVVETPPGAGVAVVRDSKNKVTIDLSKLSFGGSGTAVVEGTSPIVVTPATVGGVTTYTVSLDSDYDGRLNTVFANGVLAESYVVETEPVEI